MIAVASANKKLALALMMVITGSLNTISTKLADVTESEGIDGKKRKFNHPFFQAVGMFLGTFLLLLSFIAIMCFLFDCVQTHIFISFFASTSLF